MGVPGGVWPSRRVGVHEAADGVLTRLEADRLRARALELVAESDSLPLGGLPIPVQEWMGYACAILAELARG